MPAGRRIMVMLIVDVRVNNRRAIDDMRVRKEVDVHIIPHKEQQHKRCCTLL